MRRVLIARLQGLTADAPVEAQAAIIAEWNTLDTVDHPAARDLNARFDAAARDADKRRDDLSSAADRQRQLNDLATALEAVVADERYPAARELRQRARRLRQDWTAAAEALAGSPEAADTLARGGAADAALAERDTKWRDQRVAESDEQRRKSLQAIQRLGDLVRVENPTLKSLDRAIADAIAAETALEASAQDESRDELLGKLHAARIELQPKALALREADDWQRWANANVQERLIGEMEALAKDADASLAARRMRELSAEWKTVAAAPRERAEGLWRRFRAAADAVRAHIEPALAQQSAAQADHLAKKIALCEQAEALSNSTDWIATATTLKNLQSEWKTIGPAPRREEQAVWERFRAACNAFFTRRQDDLKQRKEVWGGNLEKKEALIARAEALGDSPEPDAAFQELKSLQAQWKAIGPVKKSKSEHVWQKFRAASEKIFDRYRNRDAAAVSDRVSRRTVLCDELEALAAQGRRARLGDGAAREGAKPENRLAAGRDHAARRRPDVDRALRPRARRRRPGRAGRVQAHRAGRRPRTRGSSSCSASASRSSPRRRRPRRSPPSRRSTCSRISCARRLPPTRSAAASTTRASGSRRSTKPAPRRTRGVRWASCRKRSPRRYGAVPESVAAVLQLASRALWALGRARRVHDGPRGRMRL